MSFIVGLTGGIGSGKSTVADLFVQRGAVLVDTDVIAHELTGPEGAAMVAIVAAFGEQVLRSDGGLDRAAMRQLVFADATARNRLEAILHPMIRSESFARCAAADNSPYVILAVPLLVESADFRERVDRVLVVDCPEDVQLARVVERSALAVDAVRSIIAAQATRAQRQAVADDLLVNDGSIDALLPRIAALHTRYCQFAALK